MTINDIDESKVEVEQKEITTPDTLNEPVSSEMEAKAIAQAMNIDGKDTNYTDELKWLLDYAKDQSDDNSLEGLKWAIRDLQDRIGTTPYLEDRVKYVARYAYLSLESKKLNTELKKMTRGINGSI